VPDAIGRLPKMPRVGLWHVVGLSRGIFSHVTKKLHFC
jgi:hypothetical protein